MITRGATQPHPFCDSWCLVCLWSLVLGCSPQLIQLCLLVISWNRPYWQSVQPGRRCWCSSSGAFDLHVVLHFWLGRKWFVCNRCFFLVLRFWSRLSPRTDRANLYYKSEVLQCICECFSPGDGTYGNNAYLDLDKQLPFLYNHPRLVGAEADT